MFKTSIVYRENEKATEDVIVNQGGTSSGKTYSILQVLFTKCAKEGGLVCTIAGQDIPNLKSGALRDALVIYDDSEILKGLIKSYNKTDRIFEFNNKSIIEFKSYDNPQDAKSGKRDYLFVNEANGVPHDVYTELALRTKRQVFVDYNPNAEFWVHEQLIGQSGVKLIISDHRHNPFLPQKIRDKIEALKFQDEELWKVYGRGLTGKIEGLIFRNHFIVPEIPAEARLIADGLDFGFTNDPTALVGVYLSGGELWLDELIYSTGLTNPDIYNACLEIPIGRNEIIADSAEPKSIAELKTLGLNIWPAQKGPDSVRNSIDVLKRYKINITNRSVNLKKEFRSYKWKKDAQGKTINEPIDFLNHGIDAVRYVALNKLAEVPTIGYSMPGVGNF